MHEKETNDDAVFRTGLRGHREDQGLVRVCLRYGSGAACLADSRTAGDHPTQAPNLLNEASLHRGDKERPFIPAINGRGFLGRSL